ncbi:MAG: hypothetical protein AAF296_14060, partial [Pseudomonadota bacterium]
MTQKHLFCFSICTLGVAAMTGCASNTATEEVKQESSLTRAYQSTRAGIGTAAMTPVEDLNLRREDIPDLLEEIDDPYDITTNLNCDEIAAQVLELDQVLGRDFDTPKPDQRRSDGQIAADGASSALLDTVASEAGGLIPFRGVVRRVSGARAWDKKVLKAYERGSHRRT